MRLEIKGLTELRDRLARADIQAVASQALAAGAERMAEAVKAGLAAPPGATDHDRPWLRTGALHDSIAAQSDGLAAAIGSNDPAAAPQELGTNKLPPRPFLAPVATEMGQAVAQSVGQAVAAALKGEAAAPNPGETP